MRKIEQPSTDELELRMILDTLGLQELYTDIIQENSKKNRAFLLHEFTEHLIMEVKQTLLWEAKGLYKLQEEHDQKS